MGSKIILSMLPKTKRALWVLTIHLLALALTACSGSDSSSDSNDSSDTGVSNSSTTNLVAGDALETAVTCAYTGSLVSTATTNSEVPTQNSAQNLTRPNRHYSSPELNSTFKYRMRQKASADSLTTDYPASTKETAVVTLQNNLLKSDTSNLILSVPSNSVASDSLLNNIYNATDKISRCKNSSGSVIDLVLAQACITYDRYYLYPNFMPQNLDKYTTVSNYVDFLRSQDRYTFWIEPVRYQTDVLPSFEGEKSTIGIQINLPQNVTQISSGVYPNIAAVNMLSRAWFDGVKVKDQIVGINGKCLAMGLTIDQLSKLLPSKEGETTVLNVLRNNALVNIATAAEENIGLILDNTIAYLHPKLYSEKTGSALAAKFKELQKKSTQPLQKFILDLRQNTGGSVDGALELVDYLINQDTPKDSNVIMVVDGTISSNKRYYLGNYSTENIGNLNKQNFVILMDSSSASSSEITAAALRDYNLATIIGSNSFGKGVTQNVFDLADDSGLFVTSHNILPPSLNSWHLVGIAPDYKITGTPTQERDVQIIAAKEFLNQGSITTTSRESTGADDSTSKNSQQNREHGNDLYSDQSRDPWLTQRLENFY